MNRDKMLQAEEDAMDAAHEAGRDCGRDDCQPCAAQFAPPCPSCGARDLHVQGCPDLDASVRHACNRGGGGHTWATCTVCGGRIHVPGCTARRTSIDCSLARHLRMCEAGQTVGIYDPTQPMFDPRNPTWQSARRR